MSNNTSHPEKRRSRVLSIRDASRYLKIPLSTLYAYAKAGKIKGTKIGRHWRFLSEDVIVSPHSRDLRKSARINTEISADLKRLAVSQLSDRAGIIKNLSEGGLFFSQGTGGVLSFKVGDVVNVSFQLELNQIHWLNLRGRVVHRDPQLNGGVGIKFNRTYLSPNDLEVIRNYVG